MVASQSLERTLHLDLSVIQSEAPIPTAHTKRVVCSCCGKTRRNESITRGRRKSAILVQYRGKLVSVIRQQMVLRASISLSLCRSRFYSITCSESLSSLTCLLSILERKSKIHINGSE